MEGPVDRWIEPARLMGVKITWVDGVLFFLSNDLHLTFFPNAHTHMYIWQSRA